MAMQPVWEVMAVVEVLIMAVAAAVDLMVEEVDQEVTGQLVREVMAAAADHIIVEQHRLIKNLFQYRVLGQLIMGL